MKRMFVLLCIVFIVSESSFAKNTNIDSITTKLPYEVVLDKQITARLGQINLSLQDISTNLSNHFRYDSILSGQAHQLVLDKQVIDNIELINSNLTKLTKDNTFLGLSWDVFMTIVVTLLVFILGYIINIVIKRYERFKETNDYREIVFWGASSNKATFTNNIDRLNNFASQISSTEDMEALRFEYAMTEIYKLNTIPFEKYISIFLLNSKLKKGKTKNDKNIYNLISAIDYLSRSEKMVFDQYERYKNDFNQLLSESNELYKQLIDICQSKQGLIEKNIINNADEQAHYNTLFNLIGAYATEVSKPENKLKRASILYSLLVEPFRDEINQYGNVSSSLELIKIISNFELIRRQWESNKEGYSAIFAEYKSNVETVYTKLESSVDYFKKDTKARW